MLYQCAVEFFPVDKDGDAPLVYIKPDPEGWEPTYLAIKLTHPSKERFVTIQKQEIAKGTLEVPFAWVEAKIRKEHAEKFQKLPPAQMFVRLRFMPTSRGEGHHLDAWTGEVLTPMVVVPMEKLPKD